MFDFELCQSQSYMSTSVLGPSLPEVQHILKVAAESVGKFLNATLWDIGEAASDLFGHSITLRERCWYRTDSYCLCTKQSQSSGNRHQSMYTSQGYRAPTVLKCFGFGCEFQRGSKTFRSQNYRWDTTHIFQ